MAEFKKGVSFLNYKFPMMDVNSPLLRKTGLSPDVIFSKDSGSFASSTGSATEVESSGWYFLSVITSTELNAETLVIVASATGAHEWNDRIFTKIRTQEDIYDAVIALNDIAPADVRSQCAAVFNTAIPNSPTLDSPYERITAIDNKLPTGNISDFSVSSNVNITNSAAQLVWNNTTRSLTDPVNIVGSAVNLIWTHPFSNYESAATERSPHWANGKLVNAINFSGVTLQIKKIDDVTNLFTQISSGDAASLPIVALDT